MNFLKKNFNFETEKDKCQIMVDTLKRDTFYKVLG